MNESKVALVIDIHKVMVILIYLYRSELALVNDVSVAQRAQIEPVVKANGVSCSLPKNVQLSLEVLIVELLGVGNFRFVPVTVRRL